MPAAAPCHSALVSSRLPAMRQSCCAWNHEVQVVGSRATLLGTDTLAGSVIALDSAVRNLAASGIALPAAAAAAGRNPLALLGVTGCHVRVVAYAHNSLPGVASQIQTDFKKKFDDDWYTGATYNGLSLLAGAMAKAKSVDPVKVAAAMEGLHFQGFQGDVEMRRQDHQLQQGLYISEWRKADAKHPYSVENTGFNFQEVKAIPAYVASTPTSCQMKRP